MSRKLFRLLALTILLHGPGVSAGELNTLQVNDYLNYEQVRDAQISPDGTQVVFTRRWVDVQDDTWKSSLWLMNADGSNLRQLVDGSNARWSRSGDRILFLATDAHGDSQIFVRWMNSGGAVSQVTRGAIKPVSPAWSPDGERIAFSALVPVDEEWTIDLPDAPDGAEWTKAPRILDDLYYRRDKQGFTEPGAAHVFVVSADAGSARQLTTGNWQIGADNGYFAGATLAWAPDSKTVFFDGLREGKESAYRRSDIYRLEVDSGEVTQVTREGGNWSQPVVSGDGRSLAFSGHPSTTETYRLSRLYVADVDGSDQKLLAPAFDYPVSGPVFWDSGDRGLYFSANVRGYTHLHYINRRGKVTELTRGEQVVRLGSLSGNDKAAVTLSTVPAPADIYLVDVGRRVEPVQLTKVNADLLVGKTLGEYTELWFEAEDGNEAHGWMIFPPDFDESKKYPLILEIHGGPFSMYRGQFSFGYQVYASNGFIVLYTNPRGSTGYGEAFSQAINQAYPSVDHLDLMAGVDEAIRSGSVDESRLYVGGCSGGGVLSSWMIGHTDRFAAAAVRCPVINWISMLGQTDVPFFTLSFFEKPFWEDPAKWLHHSSIMHVGKVTTPTIIMTGEQDMRTPMPQSEEYYAALKLLGVPTRLLRFNDQYHGTGTRPSNAMRSWLYMMSWYNQFDEIGERKVD